jgi:hypothetical protein
MSGIMYGKLPNQTTNLFGTPQTTFESIFGAQQNTASNSLLLRQKSTDTSLFKVIQPLTQK